MEEKQPVDWKQMVIMTVLIGVTAWAAMNFMSKQQRQPLPDKKPAATEKDKKAEAAPASRESAPARKANEEKAALAQPAAPAESDETAPPAEGSPRSVIEKTVALYDSMDAYSVEFHLTQPRQPKDATNPDALERLRETYHLDWKKTALNAPDRDWFRLTGVHGFNKCTVAAFLPDEQKFRVFHPHGKTVTVPAGDPRMTGLYETGAHVVARHIQRLIADSQNAVQMKKESMRLPGKDEAADYYAFTITKKDDSREIAAVNADTGALELHEMHSFNKKGKTESQRYRLARRTVWFDLRTQAKPHAADWYTAKPDFKKLNCSR
jgi:hypothetical protein